MRQQRSNKRSCATVAAPPRECADPKKALYNEAISERRNKRSTTTPPIVNIKVVERKLLNLELEKQHLHVKHLAETKQTEALTSKSTGSEANKVIEEQEQDLPAKESIKKQPPPSMRKSPPRKKKSLKDLIYETNKTIYQVDSNKVKYKVGLSKKQLLSSKAEDDQI